MPGIETFRNCSSAIALWLAACAAGAAPTVDTPPLVFEGRAAAPVIGTAPLTFAGRPQAAPVVDTAPLTFLGPLKVVPKVDTPPLAFVGTPSPAVPAVIAGPVEVVTAAIVWNGTMPPAVGRLEVRTETLSWVGAPAEPSPQLVVMTGPLVWSGRADPMYQDVEVVTGPLVFIGGGSARPAVGTSGLEVLDVPTGPRESRYLSLDNASVEYDQGLTLRYRGLPESSGYGALFYTDPEPPRLAAWFYTSKSKPDGEWIRSSLPPYTGNWKACIGFPPQVTTNSPDLTRYEDCLDFVVAGPGSLGARPTLELPPDGIRAGKDAVLRYGGMPPANCEVGIYSPAGTLVTRHFTNRAATGAWTLRLAQPGTYELRIKYLGEAVRARMPLEVSP